MVSVLAEFFYLTTFLPSFIIDCQTQRKARVFFSPAFFIVTVHSRTHSCVLGRRTGDQIQAQIPTQNVLDEFPRTFETCDGTTMKRSEGASAKGATPNDGSGRRKEQRGLCFPSGRRLVYTGGSPDAHRVL